MHDPLRLGATLGLFSAIVVLGCSGTRTESSGSAADTESLTGGAGANTTTSSGAEGADGSETSAGDDGGGIRLDVPEGPVEGPPEFPRTCAAAAAGDSSVGCEFYPSPIPIKTPYTNVSYAASNVSDTAAQVTVSNRTGIVAQRTIAPGEIYLFNIDGYIQSDESRIVDTAFVIESDQPLQVFQANPDRPSATADASIVLPAQALGTRHRVVTFNDTQTYSGRDIGTDQYIMVVAPEDNTEVTVTLAMPGSEIRGGSDTPTLDKDLGLDTATFMLNRLEALALYGNIVHSMTLEVTVDLTGTLVSADKPVAVYSGVEGSFVPADDDACCADVIGTAVPPTRTWGTEYAGVKLLPLGVEKDLWRFIADRDDTVIELSGGETDTITLQAGQHHEFLSDQVFWARGNQAFGMVHFMTGGDTTGYRTDPFRTFDCGDIRSPGDPALLWHFPVGNWLHRYLFPVGPSAITRDWCHDHATVVAPLADWNDILLNGAALPAATAIADSEHGYAYVPLPGRSAELVAPESVGVEVSVYGYVQQGSYLYPGGVGLRTLNPEG